MLGIESSNIQPGYLGRGETKSIDQYFVNYEVVRVANVWSRRGEGRPVIVREENAKSEKGKYAKRKPGKKQQRAQEEEQE